jgi:hypothetical protein
MVTLTGFPLVRRLSGADMGRLFRAVFRSGLLFFGASLLNSQKGTLLSGEYTGVTSGRRQLLISARPKYAEWICIVSRVRIYRST